MIINGKEYSGTLTCDGSMHLEMELQDITGLSIGQNLEIEDETVTYFNRIVSSIDSGHVVCEGPLGDDVYLAALSKLGITL